MMRRASILACLSAVLLATAADAAPKKAAPSPACAGRDIFTAMKKTDPEGYAKIRAAADATPNAKALLWRIEGKGQPASYLFGTIHSTDERVNKLPPAVTAAFNSSKTVALEFLEPDGGNLMLALGEQIAKKGVYTEGNGLKDVLTTAEFNTLRKTLAAEGIPANQAHVFKPWFVALTLALPMCEKKRAEGGLPPMDRRIEKEATAQGKRLAGLETIAQQVDAMTAMPEDVQVKLLKATVATIALRNDALEVLHRAYLARDLATSLPFSKRIIERAGHDPASVDVFEREVSTKRNYAMRDTALPLLQEGGAFIAVGALHLLGKEGLVELFRSAGYTVTAAE